MSKVSSIFIPLFLSFIPFTHHPFLLSGLLPLSSLPLKFNYRHSSMVSRQGIRSTLFTSSPLAGSRRVLTLWSVGRGMAECRTSGQRRGCIRCRQAGLCWCPWKSELVSWWNDTDLFKILKSYIHDRAHHCVRLGIDRVLPSPSSIIQERVVTTTIDAVKKTRGSDLPPLRNPPLLEATEDLTNLSYLNEPAGMSACQWFLWWCHQTTPSIVYRQLFCSTSLLFSFCFCLSSS